MRFALIRKLLFAYVKNPSLVYRTTGWHESEVATETASQPARRPNSPYNSRMKEADLAATEAMLYLIDSLDEESIVARIAEIETKISESKTVNSRRLPRSLGQLDIDDRARNAEWKRYEAAFIACGFVIGERNRRRCETVLYSGSLSSVDFTVQYFPLFERVLELDKRLVTSGLFRNSHEIYYSDRAKAPDLVDWFERMEIALPEGLAERVSHFQLTDRESESEPSEPTQKDIIHPKERTSMLTLIHAMAAQKPYRYDPDNTDNGAITRIQTAIGDASLSMSEPVIRKYLRAAEKLAALERDKKQ